MGFRVATALTGSLLTACGGNGGLGESQFSSSFTSTDGDDDDVDGDCDACLSVSQSTDVDGIAIDGSVAGVVDCDCCD